MPTLTEPNDGDWRAKLVVDEPDVMRVLRQSRRIAVLGIKTEDSGQAAFYVPEAAQRAGFEIIPVPVYYPTVTEILGERVYRKLADVPGDIDIVDVFRRPQDIPQHVEDILAKRPKSVWFQLGIRHDAVAETLARAGIEVIQDRCLMVDLRLLPGGRAVSG